jgi:tryptophan-rich hypothetical protein
VNKINPRKLLDSKWTAITPIDKEKHFMVTQIEFDEEAVVISCSLEAIMSKRCIPISWHDLKDSENWLQGWK